MRLFVLTCAVTHARLFVPPGYVPQDYFLGTPTVAGDRAPAVPQQPVLVFPAPLGPAKE